MKTTSVGVCALLILLQSVLYGFGDPISKAAYETMSVYSLMTVRYTIALAALLLIFGRRIVSGVRAVPVRLWLVPSLCIAGGYVLNNGGKFIEHYHGIEDIPAEHRVFAYPQLSIREQMAAYKEIIDGSARDTGRHPIIPGHEDR